MKLAIIGSRNLTVSDLSPYLPENVTEIVTGGAKGIDTCARLYAEANGIRLTEFLPEYARYGKGATHVRNRPLLIMPMRLWHFGTENHAERHRSLLIAKRRARRSRCIRSDIFFFFPPHLHMLE